MFTVRRTGPAVHRYTYNTSVTTALSRLLLPATQYTSSRYGNRVALSHRTHSATATSSTDINSRQTTTTTPSCIDVFSVYGTARHGSSEAVQLAEVEEKYPRLHEETTTSLVSELARNSTGPKHSPESLFAAALHNGDVARAHRLLTTLEETEVQPIAIHNRFLSVCLSQFTRKLSQNDTNVEYGVDRMKMDTYFYEHFRTIYVRGTEPNSHTYGLLVEAFVRDNNVSSANVALREAEDIHKIPRKDIWEHLEHSTIAAIRREETKAALPLPTTTRSKYILLLKDIGANSASKCPRTVDVISGNLLMKLQEENERRATEEIIERFKTIAESRKHNPHYYVANSANTSKLRRSILSWQKVLSARIATILEKDGSEIPINRIVGQAPEKLALFTILELIQLVSKRNSKEDVDSEIGFSSACTAVATRIEQDIIAKVINSNKLNRQRQTELATKSMSNEPITFEDRLKMREAAEAMNLQEYTFDGPTKAKIGAMLLTALIDVAKIRVVARKMDPVLAEAWDEDAGASNAEKTEDLSAQEPVSGDDAKGDPLKDSSLAEAWKVDVGASNAENTKDPSVNDPVTGDDTKGNHSKDSEEELKGYSMLPAFTHTYKTSQNKLTGVIILHPHIVAMVCSEPEVALIKSRHFPMVVAPQPWVDCNHGGYLQSKVQVLRVKYGNEQRQLLRAASKSGQLEYVFQGLDILGRLAWRVNKPVMEIALKIWNSGKEFASIPAARTMEDMEASLPPKPLSKSKEEIREWRWKCKEIKQKYRNDFSTRCSTNYKMEIAREFINETIYFPHNLDFRGRAYPIPAHFNHLGNDICRGLLLFAEARPLGERGLRWLKIHIANIYGNNKISNDERMKWTEDHLDVITLSAKDPLGEGTWWTTSEKPWQTLASCMELTNALESKDPTNYLSTLPIHQDGTCNGLQHYAALGGDHSGAEAVNLTPGPVPADVYMGVAKLVEQSVMNDTSSEDPQIQEMAKAMAGHITRKLVKQTVMTSVYGVTFIGAREQISARLKEVPALQNLTPKEQWRYSMYIATKTISSLGVMFQSARTIQNWLAVCANLISRCVPPAFDFEEENPQQPPVDTPPMNGVAWTTPLGLPIVQPYREYGLQGVVTKLQQIKIIDPDAPARVSPTRQKNAFPPNFVHSLDATHMLMTARACYDAGINFASVHDSYWTHASDVDRMAIELREQFVLLHSTDLLGNLAEEFNARYQGYLIPRQFMEKKMDMDERVLELLDITKSTKESATVKIGEEADVFEDDSAELIEELSRVDEGEAITTTKKDDPKIKKPKNRKQLKLSKEETEATTKHEEPQTKQPKKRKEYYVELKFPPLPEKGTFDVSKVRESEYFFH